MLKVVTGRFHPSLESAFIQQIQRLKAADPWAKVAILAPSKPILDRLRRLLGVEHRLSLLNLHLFTFHQLALRLADDLRPGPGSPPIHVVDDLFFEQLIRQLVERQRTESSSLRQLRDSFGTWAALWATIRDLKDGAVDPVTALQAVAEGCFTREDQDWLHALFALQAAVERVGADLKIGTADDLAAALVSSVPASSFLASLRHACYYGFYDLTQVQLSLFQAVAARVPTTLFFPLDTDPSFAFALRFFERHIQPLVGADPPVRLGTAVTEVAPPELSVRSVVGPEEELSSTCRTILDLVETHGYRFHEIGVVARTLDPYCTLLRPVFDRHRIPLTTTARRPFVHHPLCKALLLLAALPVNDFYRSAMLDLVTSPYFAAPLRDSAAYRPEQWRAVVEALNITHGLDEWRRLERASQSALELDGDGEDTAALGPLRVGPHVTALLWSTVSGVLSAYAGLPSHGAYGTLLDAFQRLVHQHLRRPNEEEQGSESAAVATLWEAIDQTLNNLGDLTAITRDVTWADFADLLTHAFERASIPLEPASIEGVMVTDAMAARGLGFKALFVLGLNEKVFPRYIREDPFLRDRHRLVLETTLGYKVGEKLPGYDEEALLLRLLDQAAERRLYLSYQRADDAGRTLAPSPYLSEAGPRPGTLAPMVDSVPRRMTEQLAQRPVLGRFLPPKELARCLAVNGTDAADHLLEATGGDAATFRTGVEALARTETDHPALTAFDGLTGAVESHWAFLQDRGIAPTPLERYARCPFRYFSADVLRLEPVRVHISEEPDVRVLGMFCHSALRRCYESLLPTGWPEKPVTDDTIDWCIENAIEAAAADVEREHRTGPYLLWEIAKASILDVMTAAIDDDTRAYHDASFAPVGFEVPAEGVIDDIPGCAPTPLKIRGRVDRVDRHRDNGALRVIDYKLKIVKSMTPEDSHQIQSAARGYRLQPPFYARLHLPDHGSPQEVQFFFLAPNWETPVARSTFQAAVWSTENGTRLRHTLGQLIDGIRNGRFFIMPDTYCKTCEYRVACRREHMPTVLRAARAREGKALAALRSLRVDR
jgi:ATP-dependent helicase/nuclease subunit B